MLRPILRYVTIVATLLGLFAAGPLGIPPTLAQVVKLAHSSDDQTEAIKIAQKQLQALGLYRGVIDGIFGQDTHAAWGQFTRAAGVGPKVTREMVALLLDAAEVARAREVGLGEAIMRAKTLPEARSLLERADKMYKAARYADAILYYGRALEIYDVALGNAHPVKAFPIIPLTHV